MIFSLVYNMVYDPLEYVGRSVKIEGYLEFFYIEQLEETFYYVVINDATGCCPQGIELMFPDDITPPDDFVDILVEGEMGSEEYLGYDYAHINVTNIKVLS